MNRVKLGDFIEQYGDGIHGTPNYDDNGMYYFVNGNNLINGRIQITDETLKVTEEEYEKIKRPLSDNTLLLSINGTLGRVAVYNGEKIALGKSACYLNIKNNKNKYFVKGVLDTQEFQKYIQLVAHGSTIKNLAPSQVVEYEFNSPNEGGQEKIAFLLKLIDDKIDNNNEINTQLESMARTIYDYWFLQFDFPDESGKPYKSSGGKMVWNEELKREIPEGWKVKRIKDCVKHINTGLNPRDNFVLGQGDIKYVTVKNLMSNGTLDFASCDTIDSRAKKIIHKRSDVAKGDILFASIAPLGRCFIVQEEPEKWDINESVFSIRPNIDMVSKEYLYLFFISQAFVRLAEFSSTGSVFYGIRISTLENMQIIIPDEDTMQKFTNYTSDILYKKYLNFIGNHELASLRDFLLPLLMNGQVGFKEC